MTRTFAKAAENSVLDTVDIPGKSSSGSIPRKQIPSKPKKPSKKPKERKEASTKLNEENSKKNSEKTTRHQASSTENKSELMFFTTRI